MEITLNVTGFYFLADFYELTQFLQYNRKKIIDKKDLTELSSVMEQFNFSHRNLYCDMRNAHLNGLGTETSRRTAVLTNK